MSGKLIGAVFEHAPYRGRRLLVLLALADAANDDGQSYASVPYLARHARTTERHCREELARLKTDGRLLARGNAGRTNNWQLRFPAEWGSLSAAVTGEKPAKQGDARRKKRERSSPATLSPLSPAAPALRDDPAAAASTAPRDRERDQERDRAEADRIAREIEAQWHARQRDTNAAVVDQSLQRGTRE